MTRIAVRVSAQAKINLHLRVFERDTTGYHDIETVFQRVQLADEMIIHVGDVGSVLDVRGEGSDALGSVQTNLAFRAARAYQTAAGWPRGFIIELYKHIPIGAGLGGGSADAGAVLRTFELLSPNPIGEWRLLDIAAGLGADVPFLTTAMPIAWAWARGDKMRALTELPRRPAILLIPDFAVSTRDAYEWLDNFRGHDVSGHTPDAKHTRGNSMSRAPKFSGWEDVAATATNDFEGIIASRHPVLLDLLRHMRASGALVSRMSGSGSTVFGIFPTSAAADAFVTPEGVRAIRTSTASHVVQPIRIG